MTEPMKPSDLEETKETVFAVVHDKGGVRVMTLKGIVRVKEDIRKDGKRVWDVNTNDGDFFLLDGDELYKNYWHAYARLLKRRAG